MRLRPSAANPSAIATRSRTTKTKPETVTVSNFPACEHHLEQAGERVSAHIMGVTIFGTHTFVCATCFNLYGMGLGLSKGQILVMGA